MPAIGRDDVMPGLGSAVESHDRGAGHRAGKKIDDSPLPTISVREIDHNRCTLAAHAQSLRPLLLGTVGPPGKSDEIARVMRSIVRATTPRPSSCATPSFMVIAPSLMPMVKPIVSAASAGRSSLFTWSAPRGWDQWVYTCAAEPYDAPPGMMK